MHRRISACMSRIAVLRSFFVRSMKLGLILTPTEQKAIALLLGLFVLGFLFKFFSR